MKKVLSLLTISMFLFFAATASTIKKPIQQVIVEKIIKNHTVQKQFETSTFKKSKNFDFWWCTPTSTTVTPLGQDMYGNPWYEVTVTYSCIYWVTGF